MGIRKHPFRRPHLRERINVRAPDRRIIVDSRGAIANSIDFPLYARDIALRS